MARALTTTEKKTILTYLGVPMVNVDYVIDDSVQFRYNDAIDRVFEDTDIENITYLLEKIAEVDLNLRNLLPASMVTATDTTKLDFTQQRNILLISGSMFLAELANYLGVEVLRNKYTMKKQAFFY